MLSPNEAYNKAKKQIDKELSYHYLFCDDFYVFDEPIGDIDNDDTDSWIVFSDTGKIEKATEQRVKELKTKYGKLKRGFIEDI